MYDNDNLKELEEGKIYTITFDVNENYNKQKIKCIRIVIKLENSMKVEDIDTDEIKWYRSGVAIKILDELPVKYLRKEKLEKIEKLK